MYVCTFGMYMCVHTDMSCMSMYCMHTRKNRGIKNINPGHLLKFNKIEIIQQKNQYTIWQDSRVKMTNSCRH